MTMNQASDPSRQSDARPQIRSRSCPDCLLCTSRGEALYTGLTDRLFKAPGEWNLKRCPNPQCGLIWLDPMPLEEDIGIAYETYFTHAAPEDAPRPPTPGARQRAMEFCRLAYRAWRFNYGDDAGKPLRWLFALPILLSRIECDYLDIPLRYLAVPEKGHILDVGCGDGSVLKLAQELGWKAEGVDFDLQAVDAARRKGLTVSVGRLADQRYADDSFDLVLMNHVIEHVHDPLETLGEVYRVLRSNGLLVVTTPNASSWSHRYFGADWRGLEPPRHLNIFNRNNLATTTKHAGFARTVVSSTLRITPYVIRYGRWIQNNSRGDAKRYRTVSQILYRRALIFAETVRRVWDLRSADELLLEAWK